MRFKSSERATVLVGVKSTLLKPVRQGPTMDKYELNILAERC